MNKDMIEYLSNNDQSPCKVCGKHCQQQEEHSDNMAYCCLCVPALYIYKQVGDWLCGNCAARQLQVKEADK